MKEITNRFGKGILWDTADLKEKEVHIVSTACMSVTSDAESFIQDELNQAIFSNIDFVKEPDEDTDIIIILGCQVTDLSILNDIRTAESYHELHPDAQIVMGGCLAYRFDIALPDWCARIGVIRKEYTPITESAKELVNWKQPFWTDKEGMDSIGKRSGDLFRNYYPLKIGAGCHGKCKYCTIRDTRGESFETDAYLQVKEFLDASENPYYEGVVLVSDSPSVKQIKDWCFIAERYNKPVSFRNVEPQTANACHMELKALAEKGLLKIFHCPIQSNNENVLSAMNRNIQETMQYITFSQVLRELGVFVATNIITDYMIGKEYIQNMPVKWLDDHFDYWVWNPYFDGKWDRKKAEKRFKKYMPEK